jgi:acetyl esterase/lipase
VQQALFKKMYAEIDETDAIQFPNSVEDCRECPPLFILTCEFDLFRKGQEEAAKLYRDNGMLLGIGVVKGCHRGYHFNFSHPRTDAWFDTFAACCKFYLDK